MSIFYFTMVDLVYPLLFFGILFTFFQFTSSGVRGGGKVVKWLMERTNPIWAVSAIILGLYIFVKLMPTAIGWILHMCGVPIWLGADLSSIDYRVGIGATFIAGITIYLIVRWLYDWARKAGNKPTIDEIKVLLRNRDEAQKQLKEIDDRLELLLLELLNRRNKTTKNE